MVRWCEMTYLSARSGSKADPTALRSMAGMEKRGDVLWRMMWLSIVLGSSRSLECWCCFYPSMAKALDVLIWEDHSYCGWASKILHHQKDGWNMLKPYKSWKKLTVNWCRISPHPRWRPFDGLIWAAAEGSGVVLLEITLRRPSTWSLWSRSSADGLMDFSR